MKKVDLKRVFPQFSHFLDDYFISYSMLNRYRKKLGEIFEEKHLIELLKKVEFEEGKAYSLRLLGKKSYSSQELRRKLCARGLNPPVIEDILQLLNNYGYINDSREGELAIASWIKRGYGPRMIQQKFLQKFGSPLPKSDLDRLYPISKQSEMIQFFLEKKKIRISKIDFPQLAKIKKNLFARGFDLDVINDCFMK